MRIIYILIFALFLISLVSSQTLGTYEKGQSINLIQTCIGSTYSNITRIVMPNSSFDLNGQYSMTKTGDNYNYSYSNTNLIGTYLVYGICDESGTKTSWQYDFLITINGEDVNLSNSILVIAFIISGIILFIIGYSFDNSKFLLKSGFFITSLFMCLLSINSSRIIASQSTRLNTMSLSGLIILISIILIYFLYVFITWTIQTFKQLKDRKELRWKY